MMAQRGIKEGNYVRVQGLRPKVFKVSRVLSNERAVDLSIRSCLNLGIVPGDIVSIAPVEAAYVSIRDIN